VKRKTKHNAVNNQEDEDSCTHTICLPGKAPFDKKEEEPIVNSSGYLFNEASNKKDELTSNRK
jgi:hypothetical protein